MKSYKCDFSQIGMENRRQESIVDLARKFSQEQATQNIQIIRLNNITQAMDADVLQKMVGVVVRVVGW